jgi:exocyst complex component 4
MLIRLARHLVSDYTEPSLKAVPVDEPETVTSRLSRYLASLAERPSDRPEYASDAPSVERRASGTLGPSASTQSLFTYALSDLPETDSYRYIETVLESLGVLGQLGPALDVVSQRVAGEIHALVENTLDEVEERCVDFTERR